MAKKRSKAWRAAKARRNQYRREWQERMIKQAEDPTANSNVKSIAARLKSKIFK